MALKSASTIDHLAPGTEHNTPFTNIVLKWFYSAVVLNIDKAQCNVKSQELQTERSLLFLTQNVPAMDQTLH